MTSTLKDPAFWNSLFASARAIAESNFTTALVGSLAGAFAGAWAAQRIAEKSKLREELLKEIRNTNAASMMLYGIANTHLGVKSQHIKALHDKYLEDENRLVLFLRAKRAGTVPPQQLFDFRADLETLRPILSPIEQIQRLVFDQISISGASLLVLPLLAATMQSLNESLLERNHIVDGWRQNRPKDLVALYFGLENNGVVDQRYKMVVEAIYRQTDDVIAFSTLVADGLNAHAKQLRKKLKKKFGVEGPIISKVDLSRFKDAIPPADEYKKFAEMFETSDAIAGDGDGRSSNSPSAN